MIAYDDDYTNGSPQNPTGPSGFGGDSDDMYVLLEGDDDQATPKPTQPGPPRPTASPLSGADAAYAQATNPLDTDAERMGLRRERLMGLLRGRLHWAILLALLFGGALGYFAYQSVEPEYLSTGRVEVANPPEIIGKDTILDMGMWTGFVQKQNSIIRGEEVARRAMRSETWKGRENPGADWTTMQFRRSLDVDINEQNRSDNVFAIGFLSDDPATAEAGANAAIQAYIDVITGQTQEESASETAKLQSAMNAANSRKNQQIAIRRTILPDDQVDQLDQQIRYYNADLLEKKNQLADVRAQIDSYSPSDDGLPATRGDLISTDQMARELQAEITALDNAILELAAGGYGPGHYRSKRESNRRQVLTAALEDRLQLLQSDTGPINDPAFDQLRRYEQIYHRQVADTEAELERLNETSMRITGIERELELQDEVIRLAQERIRDIEVNNQGRGDAIRPIAYGDRPSEPNNAGRNVQMAVAGGTGGAMLGFGLVMLVGLMDRRLRHAGDAKTGIPQTRILGILPTLPENFADPEQSEKASHAVHHIRTLLQIANGGNARVFSVTSPAAGSGKSSLSVALGLSFAASESRTLVIDCDLVGAGLTRRVGAVVNRTVEAILREDTTLSQGQIDHAVRVARDRGIHLKDALIELGLLTKKDLARLNRRQADSALGVLDACHGRDFRECVANTGIDNFHVLPIGSARPQDAGQLSPKALRSLIARAREEFDIVLIDTGPCLGSLEASMAAAEADATVLIVSRGDAKSMAARAYEHLQTVGANVVGVVFNHALDADLNHSSYASIVSQERRSDPSQNPMIADPAIAARFGPLGSAVAAYGRPSRSPNGKPRRPQPAAAMNGN